MTTPEWRLVEKRFPVSGSFLYDRRADPGERHNLASEQPVMVVVAEPRLGELREALGGDARRVRMMDMAAVGANPARILVSSGAWRAAARPAHQGM